MTDSGSGEGQSDDGEVRDTDQPEGTVSDPDRTDEDQPATEDPGTADASESATEDTDTANEGEPATGDSDTAAGGGDDSDDLDALRERVEEEYDFEDFGPGDMAEMDADEWEAAFDPDTWITGEELLDRVEADLKHRIATRDVFAVVERATHEGEPVVLAYTDDGYAMIEPDGSVEGFGTILRDAKPVVALCSMDSYDVPEAPDEDYLLPHPEEVPEGSGELGNLMMQVVAGVHLLAGVGLMLVGLYFAVADYVGGPSVLGAGETGGGAVAVSFVVGFVFAAIGLALFATVANARLSDAFRAEEYRDRLRKMGLEEGDRPEFLPVESRSRELTEEDRGDQ